MWKDFFYFQRSQRVGILVVLLLIALTLVALLLLPRWFPQSETPEEETFVLEVDSFREGLVSLDSLRAKEWREEYLTRQKLYQSDREQEITCSLFVFNPNTVDSVALRTLGLSSFVTSNILKYRAKGGVFRTPDALARIYGMSEEKYELLQPYIHIPEKSAQVKSDTVQLAVQADSLMLELNSADSTHLVSVRGIGPYYARSIIRFRQAAGGFVRVEQLLDIYGMTEDNYSLIHPHVWVDTSLVQKIKVNTASVARLKSHPCLNFYQALQIYELRRQKGKLRGMDDLQYLSEMDEKSLEIMQYYFNFE